MDVYQGMRGQILGSSPEKIGIVPAPPLTVVWGALVEMGMEGGSATVVSLADGTTSMYTSGGGGIIGAGRHQQVADASRAFLSFVQDNLDLFPPAAETPVPAAGSVSFVVLTYDGIRRAESTQDGLGRPADPLHRTWMEANKVITELRLASTGGVG